MNELSLLDAYRVHLQSRRMAATTIKTYLAIATAFLNDSELRGATEPTHADVERFLARPARDGTPRAASSLNQSIAALRALSRVATARGEWRADPTLNFETLRVPAQDARFATREEVARMFEVAAMLPEPVRSRTLALVALFVTTGLRVHEVAALLVTQLDAATSTLLDVRGKGGTKHDQALPVATTTLVLRWLEVRAALAVPGEGALFVSGRGRAWSIRGMQRCIRELGAAAELTKPVHCHALRHSVGTLGLAAGIDLATMSDVLRHGDTRSTRRYIHMGEQRKRHAADILGRLVPSEITENGGFAETSEATNALDVVALDMECDLYDNTPKVA